MSFRCPKCRREYDVTLFEFNREIICPCGERLSLRKGHEEHSGKEGPDAGADGRQPIRGIDWEALEREIFGAVDARSRRVDGERAKEIRAMADRIGALIKQSDLPRVDIEIEIRNFRAYVLEHFPEKEELFKAIYINRFRRLWDEYRKGEGPLFGRLRGTP
jgi:DNA-directed RNA polymerase subunit RPC12/RpoP